MDVQCPYCGEDTYVVIDTDPGTNENFVSDCEVCCKPIQFAVSVDDEGEPTVRARRDDE